MSDVQPWPWPINAARRRYCTDSKAAAVAWAAAGAGRRPGELHGCRLHAGGLADPPRRSACCGCFDLDLNVSVTRRRYLRATPGRCGRNIAGRVIRIRRTRGEYRARCRLGAFLTAFGGPAPLYMRAPLCTLRLALAGGGVMVLHLNPQLAWRRRHLTPCQAVAFLGSDLPAQARARGCRTMSRNHLTDGSWGPRPRRLQGRALAFVYPCTTRCVCSPSPSMPSRIVWPGLQEHRLRLDAQADAGRRAGGDDVAGMQRDEVADIADQLAHVEDHRLACCRSASACRPLPATSAGSADRGPRRVVTSHGPVGPNVSQPLPLSQVPPRSVWNSRSLTSLQTQ